MTHPTDALRLVPASVLKAFETIAKVDAKLADGDTTIVNISRIRDLVNAAAPASPLPEAGGWRDISTAPKDGTIILTYGSLHNDGAPYGIGETPTVKISQYSKEGEFWCCDAWGSHEPVWWMPLPAAPTGDAK